MIPIMNQLLEAKLKAIDAVAKAQIDIVAQACGSRDEKAIAIAKIIISSEIEKLHIKVAFSGITVSYD